MIQLFRDPLERSGHVILLRTIKTGDGMTLLDFCGLLRIISKGTREEPVFNFLNFHGVGGHDPETLGMIAKGITIFPAPQEFRDYWTGPNGGKRTLVRYGVPKIPLDQYSRSATIIRNALKKGFAKLEETHG